MPFPPFHHRAVRFLTAFVLLLFTVGCDDPKREQQLLWREEEAAAKLIAVAQREADFAKEKHAVEEMRTNILAKEKTVELLQKQLSDEIEKTRRVRQEIEIRNLRGPIPQIHAERCIVIDARGEDVLFEKNADKRGPIASTTKVMTSVLVVENGNLDNIVTVEKSDTQCSPVRLGLKEGEKYSRRQLLTAMMVKSSNDIAQALARDHTGSLDAFVAKMNEKAAALGLQNTHFVNPHGLPGLNPEDQPYSTARDLAVIARAADQMPDIREIVRLQTYKFKKPDGKVIDLANTNRVLRTLGDCDGMKTGFTEAAGYCLIATGERNGRRRIVIVLNDTESSVWRDAQALLDWALKA